MRCHTFRARPKSCYRLPKTPDDIGLTAEEFAQAVAYAPQTRPGRPMLATAGHREHPF